MDESTLLVLEGLLFFGLIAAVLWLARARVWRRPSARSLAHVYPVVSMSSLLSEDRDEPTRLRSLVELELQRARRFDYSVSLVVVQLDDLRADRPELKKALAAIADSNATEALPHAPPGTVHIFSGRPEMTINLRSTDMAVYDEEKNRFLMLLVGSKKKDALKIAERIRQQLTASFGGWVGVGCAEFPAEGYFVDDLILSAERELTLVGAKFPKGAAKTNERM